MGRVLSSFALAQRVPKLARRQHRHLFHRLQRQNRLVAGNECVSCGCNCFRDHSPVRQIDPFECNRRARRRLFAELAQERCSRGSGFGRVPKLVAQDGFQFGKHRLTYDRLMVSEQRLKKVGAQAARGECTDQDVCVEGNPHDTSRKTSSSVR